MKEFIRDSGARQTVVPGRQWCQADSGARQTVVPGIVPGIGAPVKTGEVTVSESLIR
jgi:hypothetical protein